MPCTFALFFSKSAFSADQLPRSAEKVICLIEI
ncbi:hypothetical protein X474_02375 [Dethiosulfatarculus sandiegensis]|uniref:Uncharacterized protein n=1 Tax=Dethiosulfatarculus sandiegensis TaxID=1429043 RepID=A0A0D2GLW8_9BACT|nr:hypothetical protein X474_02375 [Dethiosulfatarculus sandiegensis]